MSTVGTGLDLLRRAGRGLKDLWRGVPDANAPAGLKDDHWLLDAPFLSRQSLNDIAAGKLGSKMRGSQSITLSVPERVLPITDAEKAYSAHMLRQMSAQAGIPLTLGAGGVAGMDAYADSAAKAGEMTPEQEQAILADLRQKRAKNKASETSTKTAPETKPEAPKGSSLLNPFLTGGTGAILGAGIGAATGKQRARRALIGALLGGTLGASIPFLQKQLSKKA